MHFWIFINNIHRKLHLQEHIIYIYIYIYIHIHIHIYYNYIYAFISCFYPKRSAKEEQSNSSKREMQSIIIFLLNLFIHFLESVIHYKKCNIFIILHFKFTYTIFSNIYIHTHTHTHTHTHAHTRTHTHAHARTHAHTHTHTHIHNVHIYIYIYIYIDIHYIAKSIGSPPSNDRFDYFSNFQEYRS